MSVNAIMPSAIGRQELIGGLVDECVVHLEANELVWGRRNLHAKLKCIIYLELFPPTYATVHSTEAKV